jgi:transketolase
MGMADAATVLFRKHLKFDASAPDWADRDRFVLSNGHASMLLYGLLHLTGYEDMTIDQIRNFRQWGSITAGHPEWGHAKGIETTTGPLGQGLATAVGMALAERALAGEFPGLVDHHTWVMLGDGCLQEGLGQEAISLAGHLGLGKLNLLYDDNDITIDGPTSISFSEDVPARFRACGWHVISCDGHDANALDAAMTAAKAETARPTLIAMKTIIGFGSPNRAGTAKAHGAPLGEEEGALAKAALDWNAAPFEIPADLAASWKEIGTRGAAEREAWEAKLAVSSHAQAFRDRIAGKLPDNYENDVDKARNALFETPQKVATRKASQIALEHLASAVPAMIGGSADLTGSNLTRVSAVDSQFTAEMPGRYIGYGVREFGMAAAMNGLALHGGFKPYGGTFLVFNTPTGRTSGIIARNPQPLRFPPGRRHRNARSMGYRVNVIRHTIANGPVPAGSATIAGNRRRKFNPARRLYHPAIWQRPQCNASRHWHRGFAGNRRCTIIVRRRILGRRRFNAVLGTVRRAGPSLS